MYEMNLELNCILPYSQLSCERERRMLHGKFREVFGFGSVGDP